MIACMYGLIPEPRTSKAPIINYFPPKPKPVFAAPSKRGRHRQVMSASVRKVLRFLRAQAYPVFSLDVLHGTKVPNTRISSIFQRLMERGLIERIGVSGKFRYRAVR